MPSSILFFGPELKLELYGTKEDRGSSGLRQKLVHGEYLGEQGSPKIMWRRFTIRSLITLTLTY